MPLILPTLGRQKQVDLCEFEASLVYKHKFQGSKNCFTKKPSTETQKQNKQTKGDRIKSFLKSMLCLDFIYDVFNCIFK